eukprot:CAMPEP_0114347668 /NCGR_PEP_ID=MMETSP0101-20121206/14099_1 /TAXON_ID=38822 ORGANISM="Pteridomonas danica, Strain PT" /NCGR_SAMPLE_ID=MMETSP0101 /ASSEMBLY_ACC=CAM_ASM_000211 /LENGTH=478 /DNA_ID=CAMNT_0001485145 /DNA_START=36 /DNA_END=1472 /DNA_ORIENTATION=-
MIRYRFETPSKSSMGNSFCVVYDIKDNSGVIVVSSNQTVPVYVQTKRGGTTAVPAISPTRVATKKGQSLSTTSSVSSSSLRGGGLEKTNHHHLTRGSSRNHDTTSSSSSSSMDIIPTQTIIEKNKTKGKKRGRDLQETVSNINQSTHQNINNHSIYPHHPSTSTVLDEGYDIILQSLDILHHKVDSLSSLLLITAESSVLNTPQSSSSASTSSSTTLDVSKAKLCINDLKDAMKHSTNATELLRKRQMSIFPNSGGGITGAVAPNNTLMSDDHDDSDENENENDPLIRQSTFGMIRTDNLHRSDVHAGVASLTNLSGTMGTNPSINFDILRDEVAGMSQNKTTTSSSKARKTSPTSPESSDINDALILTSISRYNNNETDSTSTSPRTQISNSSVMDKVDAVAGEGEPSTSTNKDSEEKKDTGVSSSSRESNEFHPPVLCSQDSFLTSQDHTVLLSQDSIMEFRNAIGVPGDSDSLIE